jgi:hypothetical protein
MFKKLIGYFILVGGANPDNIQRMLTTTTQTKLRSGANQLHYWGKRAFRFLLYSLLLHTAFCMTIAAISQSVLLGVVLFLLLPAFAVFFTGSLLSRFMFQVVLVDVSAKTLFPNASQGNSVKSS